MHTVQRRGLKDQKVHQVYDYGVVGLKLPFTTTKEIASALDEYSSGYIISRSELIGKNRYQPINIGEDGWPLIDHTIRIIGDISSLLNRFCSYSNKRWRKPIRGFAWMDVEPSANLSGKRLEDKIPMARVGEQMIPTPSPSPSPTPYLDRLTGKAESMPPSTSAAESLKNARILGIRYATFILKTDAVGMPIALSKEGINELITDYNVVTYGNIACNMELTPNMLMYYPSPLMRYIGIYESLSSFYSRMLDVQVSAMTSIGKQRMKIPFKSSVNELRKLLDSTPISGQEEISPMLIQSFADACGYETRFIPLAITIVRGMIERAYNFQQSDTHTSGPLSDILSGIADASECDDDGLNGRGSSGEESDDSDLGVELQYKVRQEAFLSSGEGGCHAYIGFKDACIGHLSPYRFQQIDGVTSGFSVDSFSTNSVAPCPIGVEESLSLLDTLARVTDFDYAPAKRILKGAHSDPSSNKAKYCPMLPWNMNGFKFDEMESSPTTRLADIFLHSFASNKFSMQSGTIIAGSVEKDGPVIVAIDPTDVSTGMIVEDQVFYGGIMIIPNADGDIQYYTSDGKFSNSPVLPTEKIVQLTGLVASAIMLNRRGYIPEYDASPGSMPAPTPASMESEGAEWKRCTDVFYACANLDSLADSSDKYHELHVHLFRCGRACLYRERIEVAEAWYKLLKNKAPKLREFISSI